MKLLQADALLQQIPQATQEEFPNLAVSRLASKEKAVLTSLLIIEDQLEPAQIVEQFHTENICHLMQVNAKKFEADVHHAARLVDRSDDYFNCGYRIFTADVKWEKTLLFSKTEHKAEMKRQALEFLELLSSPAVSQTAEAIIEELYMNAVIDAPREAKKQGLTGAGTDCSIYIAASEKDLQISCSDPYGALDVSKFIARMHEVYEKGAGEVINLTAVGGAGLGCVILFENSYSMILGVSKNRLTKVTCLVPLGVSNRQRAQMKKSLHRIEK